MVLTDSKAALAALLLLCSAASASAQSSPFGLSINYVSATGLSGNPLTCVQGGGNALFAPGGALALRRRGRPQQLHCSLRPILTVDDRTAFARLCRHAGSFFYVPKTSGCSSMHGFVTSGSFPAPDAVTAINFNLSAAAWRGGVTGGNQAASRFTTATLTGANFVWVPSAGAIVTFTLGSLAAGANGFFTYNLTGYSPSSGCSSSSHGNSFYLSSSTSAPSAYGIADSAGNYVRDASCGCSSLT